MQRIFVTATNTDAGKTFVSALLLQGFRALGVTSYALKPLASGCDAMGNNADITALLQGSHLTADDINLHRFTPAIAPHLAAAQCGILHELTHTLETPTASGGDGCGHVHGAHS